LPALGATAFDLTGPTQAGSAFTYSQADPDGFYDVVVTVNSLANPSGSQAAAGTFTNPSIPAGANFTSGFFLTRWDWDDDNQVYTDAELSLGFTFEVFLTGTTTFAPNLNLIATSFDNDGSDQTTARVNEFVTYGPGASFPQIGVTQTQENLPGGETRFLGPALVEPGITDSADFVVTALYQNQSSFTWVSGHLIDGFAPDADAGAARLGALQLEFEVIPEPSVALLSSLASLLLLRRRRF
jgi:hypothetical protein